MTTTPLTYRISSANRAWTATVVDRNEMSYIQSKSTLTWIVDLTWISHDFEQQFCFKLDWLMKLEGRPALDCAARPPTYCFAVIGVV